MKKIQDCQSYLFLSFINLSRVFFSKCIPFTCSIYFLLSYSQLSSMAPNHLFLQRKGKVFTEASSRQHKEQSSVKTLSSVVSFLKTNNDICNILNQIDSYLIDSDFHKKKQNIPFRSKKESPQLLSFCNPLLETTNKQTLKLLKHFSTLIKYDLSNRPLEKTDTDQLKTVEQMIALYQSCYRFKTPQKDKKAISWDWKTLLQQNFKHSTISSEEMKELWKWKDEHIRILLDLHLFLITKLLSFKEKQSRQKVIEFLLAIVKNQKGSLSYSKTEGSFWCQHYAIYCLRFFLDEEIVRHHISQIAKETRDHEETEYWCHPFSESSSFTMDLRLLSNFVFWESLRLKFKQEDFFSFLKSKTPHQSMQTILSSEYPWQMISFIQAHLINNISKNPKFVIKTMDSLTKSIESSETSPPIATYIPIIDLFLDTDFLKGKDRTVCTAFFTFAQKFLKKLRPNIPWSFDKMDEETLRQYLFYCLANPLSEEASILNLKRNMKKHMDTISNEYENNIGVLVGGSAGAELYTKIFKDTNKKIVAFIHPHDDGGSTGDIRSILSQSFKIPMFAIGDMVSFLVKSAQIRQESPFSCIAAKILSHRIHHFSSYVSHTKQSTILQLKEYLAKKKKEFFVQTKQDKNFDIFWDQMIEILTYLPPNIKMERSTLKNLVFLAWCIKDNVLAENVYNHHALLTVIQKFALWIGTSDRVLLTHPYGNQMLIQLKDRPIVGQSCYSHIKLELEAIDAKSPYCPQEYATAFPDTHAFSCQTKIAIDKICTVFEGPGSMISSLLMSSVPLNLTTVYRSMKLNVFVRFVRKRLIHSQEKGDPFRLIWILNPSRDNEMGKIPLMHFIKAFTTGDSFNFQYNFPITDIWGLNYDAIKNLKLEKNYKKIDPTYGTPLPSSNEFSNLQGITNFSKGCISKIQEELSPDIHCKALSCLPYSIKRNSREYSFILEDIYYDTETLGLIIKKFCEDELSINLNTNNKSFIEHNIEHLLKEIKQKNPLIFEKNLLGIGTLSQFLLVLKSLNKEQCDFIFLSLNTIKIELLNASDSVEISSILCPISMKANDPFFFPFLNIPIPFYWKIDFIKSLQLEEDGELFFTRAEYNAFFEILKEMSQRIESDPVEKIIIASDKDGTLGAPATALTKMSEKSSFLQSLHFCDKYNYPFKVYSGTSLSKIFKNLIEPLLPFRVKENILSQNTDAKVDYSILPITNLSLMGNSGASEMSFDSQSSQFKNIKFHKTLSDSSLTTLLALLAMIRIFNSEESSLSDISDDFYELRKIQPDDKACPAIAFFPYGVNGSKSFDPKKQIRQNAIVLLKNILSMDHKKIVDSMESLLNKYNNRVIDKENPSFFQTEIFNQTIILTKKSIQAIQNFLNYSSQERDFYLNQLKSTKMIDSFQIAGRSTIDISSLSKGLALLIPSPDQSSSDKTHLIFLGDEFTKQGNDHSVFSMTTELKKIYKNLTTIDVSGKTKPQEEHISSSKKLPPSLVHALIVGITYLNHSFFSIQKIQKIQIINKAA